MYPVLIGALFLIASETPLTFGAAARTATGGKGDAPSASGGFAVSPIAAAESLGAANRDPAERSARSSECAQRADAQGLQGKARRHFLRECRRGS